jgi:putative phosphoribosyl transferase
MRVGIMHKFANRAAAGRKLGERLALLRLAAPAVLALPRGGVAVAVEIARALRAPLDIVMVRKVGVPRAPEVAMAAIADGPEPIVVENAAVRAAAGVSDADFAALCRGERDVIARRRALYPSGPLPASLGGRGVVIVDDGLATGATAKAALGAARRRGASRIVLAVPVAPADALDEMRRLFDDVVCLQTPARFIGVGGAYEDFHQLNDAETIFLLQQAWSPPNPPLV